jgi:hypothetical protein
MSMKPAGFLKFQIGDGFIEATGEDLCISVSEDEQYPQGWVKIDDKEYAASVLFQLGKFLLNSIGDPEVSKRVLSEAL